VEAVKRMARKSGVFILFDRQTEAWAGRRIYVGNDNDQHAITQHVMAGIAQSGAIPSIAVSESS
jgi:hypothetical protein